MTPTLVAYSAVAIVGTLVGLRIRGMYIIDILRRL
jgi:hypothetical protein